MLFFLLTLQFNRHFSINLPFACAKNRGLYLIRLKVKYKGG